MSVRPREVQVNRISELGTTKNPPATLSIWGLSDNLPVKPDTHFDPENEGSDFL